MVMCGREGCGLLGAEVLGDAGQGQLAGHALRTLEGKPDQTIDPTKN